MIDLQPFCSKDTGFRHALHGPWVKDGFRCATDGRIVIRIPTLGEPDTQGERPYPPTDDVVVPPPPGTTLNLWMQDAALPPADRECRLCRGRGQCPTCAQGCPDCEGSGRVTNGEAPVLLGQNTYIRLRHWKLLNVLPGIAWYAPPLALGREGAFYSSRKPIYFRFDGGDGAVMPYSETSP